MYVPIIKVMELLLPLLLVLPFCTTLSLLDIRKMSPCKFNPLCLCSASGMYAHGGPDGLTYCYEIYFKEHYTCWTWSFSPNHVYLRIF